MLRGTLFEPEPMRVHHGVEQRFGFAEMQVLSHDELFAGKLVAALDRAHPRDLFDVHHLLANDGFTDGLFRTFLIYLVSSGRPMHELLNPSAVDITTAYHQEFSGMATDELPLDLLYAARQKLIAELRQRLTGRAASFLESVHQCEPRFELIGLPQAARLPAVRWKLRNLQAFKENDPDRHADQRSALKALFS